MEWISVKQKKPSNNQWTICTCGHKVPLICCYKGNDTWMSECDGLWTTDEITHWIPIPEPPKLKGK